jgi:hypothetical protein
MKPALVKAILATLAYHDIFDYPLTEKELKLWLYKYNVSVKDLKPALKHLLGHKKIVFEFNRYALANRKHIISQYLEKLPATYAKQALAKRIGRFLQLVPWVQMIGLTGNLAMSNAQLNDDIDLMFICQKNRLWLSRLLVLAILFFTGNKRAYKSTKHKDKACPNLWLDTSSLSVLAKNAFTAHEVLAVMPLFDRDNVEKRFL